MQKPLKGKNTEKKAITSDLARMYERARHRYRPKRIRTLFVAEAPPSDPSRFFYFSDVRAHDWLYLALMRWIYEEARELDVDELRDQKIYFLKRFRDDGYYLVDTCDIPMPSGSTVAKKKRILRTCLPALSKRLRRLVRADTKIVLIGSRVFQACYPSLRAAGLNVINADSIDFPAAGRQRVFARKLGQLLDEQLREAISALEESERLWSPGRENQKRRERYVAEHFLRTLGLSFDPSEIEHPAMDPPDVKFRSALFEIKEIQDAGRRRHQEYKNRLEAARHLERYADLTESYSPIDMTIEDVYGLVMSETAQLTGKYKAGARQNLDLLFYVNLQRVMGVEDGARPSIAALHAEGWRSVSFLKGAATSCVMFARDNAPDFLRDREGKLFHGDAI